MVDSTAKVAMRGGSLVAGAQAVKAAIQFVSVILLARLLTPADFGLVAAVGVVVAFVGLLQDFGLRQAIVQRTELSDEQLNRAFWMLTWLGLVFALLMAASSPLVAWFYGEPELVLLSVAFAFTTFIWSLSSIPLALISRNLRFGSLATVEVIAALGGLLSALAFALAGASYWSLVIGTAVAGVVTAGGAWLRAGWRPGGPTWRLPDREMMAFGANLTGFNFVNFLARNLDNILIGRFAGIEQLGLYDRAYKLMLFPMQNIMWPLQSVAVPILSRLKADKPRFRESYLMAVGLLTLVAVPGIAATAATAPEVVAILFGPQWEAVGPILFWLCIAALAQPITASTGWIFLSQGRADAMLRIGIYSSAIAVAAFVAGLPWGAEGVAAAYAVSEQVLRFPVLAWWVGRLGPVTLRDLLVVQAPLCGAAAATILATETVLRGLLDGFVLIAAVTVLSYASALALSMAFSQNRRRLADGLTLFRRR